MSRMITVTVSEELYRVIREAANKAEQSMSAIVSTMILDYIKRNWSKAHARIENQIVRRSGRPKKPLFVIENMSYREHKRMKRAARDADDLEDVGDEY